MPLVEESSVWPVDPWAVTDWSVGLLAGAYGPLQARWRNNDCRSEWFNLGTNLIGYSKNFNHPFAVTNPMEWVGMTLNLGVTSIALLHVILECGAELRAVNAGNYWYQDFNMLTEDVSPVVESSTTAMVGNYTVTRTITTSITLALEAFLIYTNGKSEYYYFFWAKLMGAWVMQTFIAIDAWTETEIITPTFPWVLYAAQA